MELQRELRRKRVSAVELARETCQRLADLGPRYNAIATVTADRALAEAKAADRAIAARKARPLTGIPYGAKDLLAARGAPTTWGVAPYRDQRFDFDAAAVERLRRAGAVLAAKLAMVELAGGGGYRYPSASLQGPGRNPWNVERWSGGSSSGSGAAVAAGLVPFALGSETSGSIGTPSAYCGVTGLRPTYGLVSRRGAMALSWTLDKIGPMARTAEDCALVLEAIAGPDAGDPTVSGKRFRAPDRRASGLRRIRVGYAGEEIAEAASAEAKGALLSAIDEMRRITPRFVDARLPEEVPYGPLVATVYAAEGATIHAELIESERFEEMPDAKQKAGLRAALEIKARDYLQAMRVRSVLHGRFREIFEHCDVILSCGRNITATPIEQPLDAPAILRARGEVERSPAAPNAKAQTEAAPAETPARPGNIGLIAASNLAGLPAIFFPCGFGTDGLPVGLQLVGPPFSESLLVAIASAYQRATDHHLRRPAV